MSKSKVRHRGKLPHILVPLESLSSIVKKPICFTYALHILTLTPGLAVNGITEAEFFSVGKLMSARKSVSQSDIRPIYQYLVCILNCKTCIASSRERHLIVLLAREIFQVEKLW